MNRSSRYSGVSTANHWITVILVVAMLLLGFLAAGAPDDTVEEFVMAVHVSLGFFVFLFVVWRVAFRLYEGFPDTTVGETAWERWTAYVVHRLLLIVLTLQVLTGPLYLFTEGEAVNVFGWFSVYLPLERLSGIHELMEVAHVVVGLYVIPALLLLHIAGAVRHYLSNGLGGEARDVPRDV